MTQQKTNCVYCNDTIVAQVHKLILPALHHSGLIRSLILFLISLLVIIPLGSGYFLITSGNHYARYLQKIIDQDVLFGLLLTGIMILVCSGTWLSACLLQRLGKRLKFHAFYEDGQPPHYHLGDEKVTPNLPGYDPMMRDILGGVAVDSKGEGKIYGPPATNWKFVRFVLPKGIRNESDVVFADMARTALYVIRWEPDGVDKNDLFFGNEIASHSLAELVLIISRCQTYADYLEKGPEIKRELLQMLDLVNPPKPPEELNQPLTRKSLSEFIPQWLRSLGRKILVHSQPAA
ncbi:MAG: hypothetical protein ABIE68_00815 [bacterium]